MPSVHPVIEPQLLRRSSTASLTTLLVLLVGCGGSDSASAGAAGGAVAAGGGSDEAGSEAEVLAFTGATIWDGTGAAAIPDGVMLVQEGRIIAVGSAGEVSVPGGATQVRLEDRWVTPGLINAHGHVGGDVRESNPRTIVLGELERYARFGITTVNSLGNEPDMAAPLRDALDSEQTDVPPHARLLMSGLVVTGETPEEAVAVTNANADLGVDYIKIRVDDNLGTTRKMTPDVFAAVIDAAHARNLPLSAHVFYLDDTKELLRAGADLIGHSVRDQPVDAELIDLLADTGVCYVPTLMREVSTFVYRDRPDFLDDPFLTSDVDSAQVDTVEDPTRRSETAASRSAALYEEALAVASANLNTLFNAGVTIAMGTDTGPLGRFQGYFEHLELALMVEAGLTAEQALLSATRDAARCLDRPDLGTLVEGNRADFVVYGRSPLEDISNTKTRERVFVGGRTVAGPNPAEM